MAVPSENFHYLLCKAGHNNMLVGRLCDEPYQLLAELPMRRHVAHRRHLPVQLYAHLLAQRQEKPS